MKNVRLALVLAILIPTAVADPANSDAGSGADAPNAESELFLIGSGSLSGYLKKFDADWYRSYDGSSNLACVALDASSDITSDALLVVRDGSARREARVTLAPGSPARLVYTANSLTDARVGILNNANGGEERGYYGFALTTRTMSDFASDANTGTDAPSDAANAPVVGSGCTGGRLGLFDTRDSYRFSAAPGDVAVVSYATTNSDATLELVAADGSVLGTVLSGQQLSVALPDSGMYTMRSSASAPTGSIPYMMSLVVGPPGQGCRPMCISG